MSDTELRALAEAALPLSLTVPAPMRPYAAFLDAVTPEVVLDLLTRAEHAEAELERFEPWCSCGVRKGQRADGLLICLAGTDHGDRLPTHWTKRP